MLSPEIRSALLAPTVDVVTAGKLLGIGRDAAFRAAESGEIPTIKLNSRRRVPTAKLREMLGITPEPVAA